MKKSRVSSIFSRFGRRVAMTLFVVSSFIGAKAVEHPTVNFHENQVAEKAQLIQEGKTWWYICEEDGWTADRDLYEFGVTIGSKTVIDGQEWNKVYLRLYYDHQEKARPWTEFDENSGLYGYIREENGIVYSKTAIDWDMVHSLPLFDLQSMFIINELDNVLVIGDFNQHDSTFVLGNVSTERPIWDVWTMTEIRRGTVDSHGHTYYCLYANGNDYIPTYCFVEGIGAVDDGGESYGTHLFNLPFYAFKACPCNNVAYLTYVTDPSNNILFESAGGEKLWEKWAAVETITADASEAAEEYYNLMGAKVDNPDHGLYIVRQGSAISKVLLK